jgi:hypothetical protein
MRGISASLSLSLLAACGGQTALVVPGADGGPIGSADGASSVDASATAVGGDDGGASSSDGSVTDATADAGGGATACIPGQSVACVGPGGCSTNQVCNSSGSGFGPCSCAGADASVVLCIPGQSIACSGPGGCISSQACLGDGSGYGACVCSGDSGGLLLCVPGQSIACAGEYGCASFQVCDASGTAYGPCDCPVFDDAGALPDGSIISSVDFGPAAPIEQHILAPPQLLVSDGHDLFWIDENGGIWRDPVTGGAATEIASGANAGGFLYFDSTNVYFLGSGGISAVPKQSGPTTVLIATSNAQAGTVYEGTVYWVEQVPPIPPPSTAYVKSAPLVPGATVTTLNTIPNFFSVYGAMAVFGSTTFLPGLYLIPFNAGAPTQVGESCNSLPVGTAGVYCPTSASVDLIAPNGTITTFSSEANQAVGAALDESNLYWANDVASGSVVAAPLIGGPYVTIAYDAYPSVVAVDANAVYFSDTAGNIERALKVK